MTRRLSAAACAISLVLCAATIALWVRSGLAIDEVIYVRPLWVGAAASEHGGVCFTWDVTDPSDPFRFNRLPIRYHSLPRSPEDPARAWNWRFIGFRYQSFGTPTLHVHTLVVPFWVVVLCWLVLPAWLIHRARTRPPSGCCKSCGYDLRASNARCPECGTLISDATESAA